MRPIIIINLLAVLLFRVSTLSAQSGSDCHPAKLVDAIENFSQTPVSDALDVYDSETASAEELTNVYLKLTNFRFMLEQEWENIEHCGRGYIALYVTELRITSNVEDILVLAILLKAGIAEDDGSVQNAQRFFLEHIVDDMTLVTEIIENN